VAQKNKYMTKKTILFILLSIQYSLLFAQPTPSKEQQELEKQRQQLKKELEQVQEQLSNNQKVTKENLSTLAQINHKMNIQGNVIDNISKEINLMDNTIYKSARDVYKLQRIYDTLKQEYAKSMVYSYKNRSSADFINFIFSASSFNDAIKRITYLKSYRNYREMQGENIDRTKLALKERIVELNQNKEKKNTVLEVKSKELNLLEEKQKQKNQIVQKLKAQGKELNNQLAAKKKQMQKVNNAIQIAIKLEIEKSRKEAAAKAAAAKRAENANPKTTATAPATNTKNTEKRTEQKSVLLASDADVTLNSNFERNRGNLPWPVNSGFLLLQYGPNKLENGIVVNSQGISIGCDIGSTVKCIFDGEVLLVNNYDDVQMVVIKHGRYFSGYSNLKGVSISKGQMVKVGQIIGKAAANLDGVGAVDLQISSESSEQNPESWLKRR
jgi:septal ring factor EnvC (AmiA/AmiB activator)